MARTDASPVTSCIGISATVSNLLNYSSTTGTGVVRRRNKMTLSITDIRQANPMYFSKENTKFSGDISCRVLHDKQRKPYLVRLTHQGEHWFDSEHITHWIINPIGISLGILPPLPARFATLADVKKILSKSTVDITSVRRKITV